MKNLLLVAFLIPFYLFSQKPLRDSVFVKTPIYEVMYSEKLESPLWLKYTVLCPTGTTSRSGMDFYMCDSIKTSDNADYVNNVWDKGHMAPAADFNCTKEMLKQTFSYLNCALQNQYLNRGVWRLLEMQEREWAKTETVQVTIVVEFKNSTKLPSGATVPSGFYKTIYLTKTKKTYKYYFPNKKPTTSKFADFLIK
jgi:endonuclease G, mitochondrial